MKFRPASAMMDDAELAEAVKQARDPDELQRFEDQRQAAALFYDAKFRAINDERDEHFRRFNRVWSAAMEPHMLARSGRTTQAEPKTGLSQAGTRSGAREHARHAVRPRSGSAGFARLGLLASGRHIGFEGNMRAQIQGGAE
jgi:hypothetical protein